LNDPIFSLILPYHGFISRMQSGWFLAGISAKNTSQSQLIEMLRTIFFPFVIEGYNKLSFQIGMKRKKNWSKYCN